jgi:hypothetical protein
MIIPFCAFMMNAVLHIGMVTYDFHCHSVFATSSVVWLDAGSPFEGISGHVVNAEWGEVKIRLPTGDAIAPIPDVNRMSSERFVYLPDPRCWMQPATAACVMSETVQ